jgi:ribonucleotide monophosphatase NagD (HAD superfamily)
VVGLAPERLSYQFLNEAFHILNADSSSASDRKPSLIATHRAAYYRDDQGMLSLGPGPFVSALEQAAGLQAIVVGKPSKTFVRLCLGSLSVEGISENDWPHIAMVCLISL